MNYKVLSYNLNFGQAFLRLPSLIEEHQPDLLVLQELDTLDETITTIGIEGFELADFSHSFGRRNSLYGVATYYRKDKFSVKKNHTIVLPFGIKEILDFIFKRTFQKRTVLKTHFETKDGKDLIVYNVHLSAYTSNNLRLKQIRKTFETLDTNGEAMIVLGDFNYPYGRKRFEKEFKKYGMHEASHTVLDTFKSNLRIFPFRLKLDYVLYKNMKNVLTHKVAVRFSDHFPLLTSFEL